MSKKKKNKNKAAPARAAASKSAASKKRAPGRRAVATNRTASATIFLYAVDGRARVRTSPQYLVAGPGYIQWTVVNLASVASCEVEISWPGESPWGGKESIAIRDGHVRRSLAGARNGIYKYSVTANGYTEDPEIEIPEM